MVRVESDIRGNTARKKSADAPRSVAAGSAKAVARGSGGRAVQRGKPSAGARRRKAGAPAAGGILEHLSEPGRDALALLALSAGLFLLLAAVYPEFSQPAGTATRQAISAVLGWGVYFFSLPFFFCAPLAISALDLRSSLRLIAAGLCAILLASLWGGVFTAQAWGGIVGSSAAALGYRYLGGFYPIIIALLTLLAVIRIGGRALIAPLLHWQGRALVQAGSAAQTALAAGAGSLAAAAAERRDAVAERRARVLAAELEAFEGDDASAVITETEPEYDDEPLEGEPLPRRRGAVRPAGGSAVPGVGQRRTGPPVRLELLESPPGEDGFAAAVDAASGEAAVVQRAYVPEEPARAKAAAQPLEAAKQPPAQAEAEPSFSVSQPQIAEAPADPAGQLGLFGSTQEGYELPPLSLLSPSPRAVSEKRHLAERAATIERTLASFNVDAKCVNATVGPRVTRYELKIGPGINVSRIHTLADNLALELAVKAVRIEAPIPGMSAVGIEVPNASPQLVTLRNILESSVSTSSNHPLTVGLGRDIAGKPVVANLAKMPHLLVAGSTGSGKSVCLNALIVNLLMRNAPDTLRLILIDPKRVEMTSFAAVPHLACPVVSDVQQAQSALKWVVAEMDRRYRLLQVHKARNIASFNAEVAGSARVPAGVSAEGRPPQPLPYIVVVIDELADLMMLAGQAVEKLICRIAQLSRAVGIHLVIATQRPDVKVITGTIKANVPSRIAFATVSQIDSRTILDGGGAEKLLGSGDMLFMPIGEGAPVRVQGCYLSDDEIDRVVEYCAGQAAAHFDESIVSFGAEDGDGAGGDGLGSGDGSSPNRRDKRDEYFDEAAELVRDSGRASTSYLQRRLKIGYNRAARVMEELENAGIVSAPDARGDRKVL